MKRSVRRLGVGVLGVLMLTVSVLSFRRRRRRKLELGSRCASGPPALPCMRNRFVRVRGISGRRVIGHGMTGRVLLGSRHVGSGAGRHAVDAGLLGFAGGFYGWHGGIGTARRLLRRINYGFGYGGVGFGGGEWRGGAFFYNRSVMNVDVHNVTNVYNRTVVVNNMHTSSTVPAGSKRGRRRGRAVFARAAYGSASVADGT